MNHQISPTTAEFEAARGVVELALATAADAFPMDRDVAAELGWGGDEFVVVSLDGAMGFTSPPNRVELEFNTAAPAWRDALASTTVHEYAHVWTYDRRGGESEDMWEYVLEEAFTQHVAKRLVPEYESPWWTGFDRESVAEHWDDVREELGDPSQDGDRLYVDAGADGYPLGLGYSLSFQVGERLLCEHDLTDVPTLDRDALVDAGEALYRSSSETA